MATDLAQPRQQRQDVQLAAGKTVDSDLLLKGLTC